MLNIKIDSKCIQEQNIKAIAKVYANTFEGNVYDPFLNPNVLDNKNVNNIVKAIRIIINEDEDK